VVDELVAIGKDFNRLSVENTFFKMWKTL